MKGFKQGAIFPYRFDYSQFIAARPLHAHAKFAALFRRDDVVWPRAFATRMDGKLQPETIRQGLLWTRALHDAKLGARVAGHL